MFEDIEVMRMARAMTAHAAQRQITVARNIANSDTPDFKAQDIEPFAEAYHSGRTDMRQTRSRHLPAPDWSPSVARRIDVEQGTSPNGNSVSLEEEMVRMAETRRQHDLSINIYRSALNMMRTSIGRRN